MAKDNKNVVFTHRKVVYITHYPTPQFGCPDCPK